jgi:ribose 5-phosphate isomerase B
MKIAVASDHRGTEVKSKILEMIRGMGYDALDYGPEGNESVDYPDFAGKVAESISKTEVDRGVLICGTGIGMCMVANKFNGVRAASVWDDLTAQMSRLHNDANVLCLSADLIGEQSVDRMIDIWLKTEFEGGRHARRVEKITQIEENRDSG